MGFVLVDTEIILLFVFAFLPPIIYAIWIRNTEIYNREKWIPIAVSFLWGASVAVIASIILELTLGTIAFSIYERYNIIGLSTAIIIAPFAEELTKPLVLSTRTVRRELDELEDGLIYGAVAGLGFSATENLFYGYDFLNEGLMYFIVLIAIRSFGGCLLHASATALTGYGYGKAIIRGKSILRVFPFFLIAVFLHGFYNFLVSFEFIGVLTGLVFALLLVAVSIRLIRSKIRRLDRR